MTRFYKGVTKIEKDMLRYCIFSIIGDYFYCVTKSTWSTFNYSDKHKCFIWWKHLFTNW